MNEIGKMLQGSRLESGVSLEEASADLKIKTLILENIEDGNIGCFKDIFVLKDYIYDYAKYLGLDADKTIDSFNEYLFEYTSKIPVEEIEKEVERQKKEEEERKEEKIVSPYTVQKNNISKLRVLVYIVGILIVIFLVVWSVIQLAIDNGLSDLICYVR
mgnify:CR=1 FL=1